MSKTKHTHMVGYWSRLEWPEPGGMSEQCKLLIDIFTVISDELDKNHIESLGK